MSDLIFITCPCCDSEISLHLLDNIECPYCNSDLDGVPYIITNIFEEGDVFQDEVN